MKTTYNKPELKISLLSAATSILTASGVEVGGGSTGEQNARSYGSNSWNNSWNNDWNNEETDGTSGATTW